MLITSTYYFLSIIYLLSGILCFLSLFFRKNLFVFTKIWIVLVYFIFLNLTLGFLGEDFFIVFALAAELPVFFGFFFFFMVKSQLNNNFEKITFQKTKWSLFLLLIFFCGWGLVFNPPEASNVYNFYDALLTPQRSDFYIFYFTFYFLNPQLIIFIGTLITVLTFLLIILSFITQIKGMENILNKKKINWVKTQNFNKQVNQVSSVLFFRL